MDTIYDAKLLLVDDNAELLALLCEQLRGAGYGHIRTAQSCAAARVCFAAEQPELMILDINLPDGDGFSLLRALRAKADVPALFLSARDADADRLFGLGLGADDYLTKPFLMQELLLRVQHILQLWLNTLAQYESSIPSVTVDGVYGSGTASAVRAFQRRYGLSVDGVVGRATWTELYNQFRSIQSDNGRPNAYPGTALRQGSSGQNVRLVQFWLKIARTVYPSLNTLTVDGKFGAGTAAAVRRFQSYFGLTSDGVVGRTTWNKLYEVYNDIANRLLTASLRPGEYPGILRRGSTGTAVRELQFYLYLMSAYESSIPVVSIDGSFGAATENAVRAYQRFAKLTVDGVVGQATWNSLYGKASILRVSGPVVTLKRLSYPGTPLAVGATGDAVLYYNLLLQRIAYYFNSVESPPLSDRYTDETAASTRSAQALLDLPETGAADAETWTAVEALSLQLAAVSPNPDRDAGQADAYPGRAMKEGSVGPDVGQIEQWLNGRYMRNCGEDYVTENFRFGPKETEGVRAAQERADLLVTGTVNEETWAALRAQSCECEEG